MSRRKVKNGAVVQKLTGKVKKELAKLAKDLKVADANVSFEEFGKLLVDENGDFVQQTKWSKNNNCYIYKYFVGDTLKYVGSTTQSPIERFNKRRRTAEFYLQTGEVPFGKVSDCAVGLLMLKAIKDKQFKIEWEEIVDGKDNFDKVLEAEYKLIGENTPDWNKDGTNKYNLSNKINRMNAMKLADTLKVDEITSLDYENFGANQTFADGNYIYYYFIDGEVVYVGKTVANPFERWNEKYQSLLHYLNYHNSFSTDTQVASQMIKAMLDGKDVSIVWTKLPDNKDIDEAEQEAIQQFHPKLNQRCNYRYDSIGVKELD